MSGFHPCLHVKTIEMLNFRFRQKGLSRIDEKEVQMKSEITLMRYRGHSFEECVSPEKKGITLIALVITIIVLLILAGVTINTLMGEGGVIKQATDAKQCHKMQD